jgi:hypothetical protein
MARRKRADSEGADPSATAPPPIIPISATDDPPPPYIEAGEISVAWVRWAYRNVAKLLMDVAMGVRESPKGFNPAQWRDFLDSMSKNKGWDPKNLQDTRTDAQINRDWAETLLKTPEEIFSAPDSFLDEAEKQMDVADEEVGELVGAAGTIAAANAEIAREVLRNTDAKKKWLDRIKRVKRLRDRARNPIPANSFVSTHLTISHPLRYMIYVSRPGGSTNQCYQIGRHHAMMALALYSLDKGKKYQDGVWRDYPATGALLVCPPGHGKTSILICCAALWLSMNPRLRIILLHAQAEQSEKNLAFLCTFFQPAEMAGRRNLSLFPGNRIIQQNASTMRLYVKDKQRQASVVACGVNAKENGSDADILMGDDICDQQIAEQDAERNRVFDRLNGTWRRRLRDGKTREILTTTLWHHDDPHCRIIRLAREGKIKYLLCVQECGGPDNNFKPLWASAYPASKLRSIYNEMRNPRLYAAAYQSNPMPEEQRPIRRLAYYDPSTESHAGFMQSAVFHVSLDPAATANDKSDHASFIYAGIGDVRSVRDGVHSYVRRLRIVDAERIKAKQTDAVSAVCHFAEGHSVHYVHGEVVAGFAALRELFEARGLDMIVHKPHNRSKGLRLKDVATMLDDSLTDRGLSPAVVEFPGKEENGKIVRDPDSPLAWLEKQILEFGVAAEDDGLDAVTQLCKHLGSDLGVGQGEVTQIVQRAAAEESRVARMLRQIEEEEGNNKRSAHEEETGWLNNNRGEL